MYKRQDRLRGSSTGSDAGSAGALRAGEGATADETTTVQRDAERAAAARTPSPDEVVRSFYERAARDDFEGAWALAGPGFRSQLKGFQSFRNTVSTLESIRFVRVQTVRRSAGAATVALRTLATHPDRVDRCSGTVSLEPVDAEWRIERAAVSCAAQSG